MHFNLTQTTGWLIFIPVFTLFAIFPLFSINWKRLKFCICKSFVWKSLWLLLVLLFALVLFKCLESWIWSVLLCFAFLCIFTFQYDPFVFDCLLFTLNLESHYVLSGWLPYAFAHTHTHVHVQFSSLIIIIFFFCSAKLTAKISNFHFQCVVWLVTSVPFKVCMNYAVLDTLFLSLSSRKQ